MLTEADRIRFLLIEGSRVGASQQRTPREVIRDFIELLDIVAQDPQADIAAILQAEDFAAPPPPAEEEAFAEFEI